VIPTAAQIGHDQIGIAGHDLGITGHTLLGMGGHDGSEYAVVTEIYDFRCAATGLRLVLRDGAAMVEAAHIHPFSETGDDDPRNGLALTPDMHWALYRYLIAPDTDFRWRVSPLLDPRIPDYRALIALEGKSLFLPREARMYPKREAIEWRLSRLGK